MQARLTRSVRRFIADENGGEIIEYVLIAGLIIAGCIVVVGAFGGKVVARWNSVNTSM